MHTYIHTYIHYKILYILDVALNSSYALNMLFDVPSICLLSYLPFFERGYIIPYNYCPMAFRDNNNKYYYCYYIQ